MRGSGPERLAVGRLGVLPGLGDVTGEPADLGPSDVGGRGRSRSRRRCSRAAAADGDRTSAPASCPAGLPACRSCSDSTWSSKLARPPTQATARRPAQLQPLRSSQREEPLEIILLPGKPARWQAVEELVPVRDVEDPLAGLRGTATTAEAESSVYTLIQWRGAEWTLI